MTFAEILDEARDAYVRRLAAAIGAHPPDAVIGEPALRAADGSLALEGAWSTPRRMDLCVLKPAPQPVEVAADGTLAFSPVRFEWEGVPVEVAPFAWCHCPVRLPGVGRATEFRPLLTWFAAWFDTDDTERPLADGLHGAVHALGEPRFDDASTRLTIDLGSAPTDAVEHLLDALARLEPSRIELGAGPR